MLFFKRMHRKCIDMESEGLHYPGSAVTWRIGIRTYKLIIISNLNFRRSVVGFPSSVARYSERNKQAGL